MVHRRAHGDARRPAVEHDASGTRAQHIDERPDPRLLSGLGMNGGSESAVERARHVEQERRSSSYSTTIEVGPKHSSPSKSGWRAMSANGADKSVGALAFPEWRVCRNRALAVR